MNVTINTDASYNHEHKVGAFAFWIVSDQGKILQTGPLKQFTDCLDAEIQAIGNAFHALLASKFTGVKCVYVNADSIPAIHQVFKNKVKRRRSCSLAVRKIIEKVAEKYKLHAYDWLEIRHVKAHSGKETQRKWVNDWCDKAARQQMQRQVLKKWLKT